MADINLAKAVLLREAEESRTIFGNADEMLEMLIHAAVRPAREPGSKFGQLRALATSHGFILKTRSQLNSAALRRFLECGEPEMAILAAEIMQECGVKTHLEVGELEFEPETKGRDDRIYAFSERKLLVKTIGDDDFGFVTSWHTEAYWQEWYRDVGVEPGHHWNKHYESYVHWPRIEKSVTVSIILKTFKICDPPLELPRVPPEVNNERP